MLLQSMDSGNSVCDVCQRQAPGVFCQCTVPETLLCTGCLGKHVVNNTGKEHPTRPIQELSFYKIPGYFQRLGTRKGALPRVQEHAWKSVGEVDRALDEYTRTVEWVAADYSSRVEEEVRALQQSIAQLRGQAASAIGDLRTQSAEQVAELQKLKADLTNEVQAALEEVGRTLDEDAPQLSSSYGPLFRQLTETSQALHLFSFQIHTSPTPTVTLTTHLQEGCQPPPTQTVELAQVTSTFIRFFNCQSSTWGPQIFLHDQIKADSTSSWVVLKDKQLFCSGGGSEC